MIYRVCLALGFGFFTLFFAGCGGGPTSQTPKTGATVSGKITFSKIPLNVGQVTMHGKDLAGKEYIQGSPIQEDGTYKVENAPLGEVKVSLFIPPPAPAGPPIKPLAGEKPNPVSKVNLPSQYTSPATSKITLTVKAGEQTFDINLPLP